MDFKQTLRKYMNKIKSIWNAGKIQRSSRIMYDVSWNVVLFFLLIGFIGLFFAGGIGAGYFASLVKDEPIRSYASMEKDIYNYEETSKLYFAGNTYFGDVRSELHREEVSLDKISDLIINATKATEDQSFDEHNGVVPKAIVRAIIQEATNADLKSGGSTLTQQLIKNQILTNEVSFERKAKEILLALRLENFFEKNQILEAYLNIIPYGREASGQNIAGIQTAAKGIFGIDAKDVNLPQAAYLAGLPQSPSAYTPFASGGGLKDDDGIQRGLNRMKTVLSRMLDSDYITQKQYDEALNYDIVADFTKKTTSPVENYPRLTYELQKRARDIIMDKLLGEDDLTKEDLEKDEALYEEYKELAERDLRRNGYNIYSTIDKKIYDKQKEVAEKYEYYGPDWTGKVEDENGKKTIKITQQVQTGGAMIENKTGKIISFIGGREYNQEDQLNYMTAARQNGSTMKPLLDYGPALEKGVVQPGTPIADVVLPDDGWLPGNYGKGYHGIVSAREALAQSYNVPAVKIYKKIINDNPAKEFLDKMGITTLIDEDYEIEPLAIGSMANGIPIVENINAFTTFGNNGQFNDAYMIEKITTNDGGVIYEHENKPVDVFTPQTNYLTLDLMRDVVWKGTAAYIPSQLNNTNVDWAGKTGTSNDYHDAWFVGVNPNITFGTWIGYRIGQDLKETCQGCALSYSQRNNKLWAELINATAEIKPDLITPSNKFERPEGIVEKSYCAISGMKPSELCKKAGLVKSDLFNVKYVPKDEDDSLVKGAYVMVDGKAIIAGKDTPEEFTDGDGIMFNPEFLKRNGYDKLTDLTQLFPQTDREKWEKIGIPNSDLGEDTTLKDDEKDPSAPTSLSNTKNKLTWKKSSSKDVVGYRVYRSNKPEGSFKLVESTIETDFTVSGKDGVYHVTAVDYFGLESSESKELVIGDVPDKDDRDNNNKNDNGNGNSSGDNNSSNDDSSGNADDNNDGNDNNDDDD